MIIKIDVDKLTSYQTLYKIGPRGKYPTAACKRYMAELNTQVASICTLSPPYEVKITLLYKVAPSLSKKEKTRRYGSYMMNTPDGDNVAKVLYDLLEKKQIIDNDKHIVDRRIIELYKDNDEKCDTAIIEINSIGDRP